jgi:hypothetical protein
VGEKEPLYTLYSWAYIQRNVSQQTRETLICTPRFIASLFTIAKLWNQPKCPSTDECIKKLWYGSIHNGVLFSHKKHYVIFRKMDGPGDYHVKRNKPD